jgi:CBS domain-containing protein
MAELRVPILGFDPTRLRDIEVVWGDGRPVGGLLGSDIREALARCHAEEAVEAKNQQLRDQDVIVLSDHRRIK